MRFGAGVAASTSAGPAEQVTKLDLEAPQADQIDWDSQYWESECSWGSCGVPCTVVGDGFDLSLMSGDLIQRMECRDLLGSEFVGSEWVLERGWGEEVVVVGLRLEVVVDDCGDGELFAVHGSGMLEIGFRCGRGRRGLLRTPDICSKMLAICEIETRIGDIRFVPHSILFENFWGYKTPIDLSPLGICGDLIPLRIGLEANRFGPRTGARAIARIWGCYSA